MKQIVPGKINGRVSAPPSKSVMQRVVAAAALAHGQSIITNPSYSEDGKAALRIAGSLGAEIEKGPDSVVMRGGNKLLRHEFDCGESGLSMRLFSAIAALYDNEITMRATGSLAKRPMHMVIETLREQGIRVHSDENHAPLKITGPLKGGRIQVDGALSSQFVSGLLMALPVCDNDSELIVSNLRSADYVHITLEVLAAFGIEINIIEDNTRYLIPGRQRYRATDITIEGDWSGAAFLLVAAAIAGKVSVEGLRQHSYQADRHILDALRQAGCVVEISGSTVSIREHSLQAFQFDATDCPDLFPPLVALASYCSGVSHIRGIGRLTHKESNRATSLQQEFGNLGILIALVGDNMMVHGGPVRGGKVSSHGDHRIAMACAVAALGAETPVKIEDENVVAKSYQYFFDDLESIREVL